MITGPYPCYECGVNIKQPRFQVHVYDGGRKLVMQGEDEASLIIEESADLGWHFVGPGCARKLTAKGILVERVFLPLEKPHA